MRRCIPKTRGIDSPTLVIGLIEGGVNTNVVPDRVVFRLDRRIIPEEAPAEVEEALTHAIRASAARWPGVRVEIRRVLLALPFVPMAGQQRLVDAIVRNARVVLGEDIEAHGVPIYTDARHYSAAGVPTVLYGAGPRTLAEANGHRADENLRLDDLYKATEVVALSLYDLLVESTAVAFERPGGLSAVLSAQAPSVPSALSAVHGRAARDASRRRLRRRACASRDCAGRARCAPRAVAAPPGRVPNAAATPVAATDRRPGSRAHSR